MNFSRLLWFLAVSCLVDFCVCENGPIKECDGTNKFVADVEDLCRYHWCLPNNTQEMPCAPGARVPSWWVSGDEVPCKIDRQGEVQCCRCELPEDETSIEIPDFCVGVNCPSGCTCQSHHTTFVCLCGDQPIVGHVVIDASSPREDYCEENLCQHGGTCHSQWNDYWCGCADGYTGKNCGISTCNPNPCENGGTCVPDHISYHCDCLPGWGGYCCKDKMDGSGTTSSTQPSPKTNLITLTPPIKTAQATTAIHLTMPSTTTLTTTTPTTTTHTTTTTATPTTTTTSPTTTTTTPTTTTTITVTTTPTTVATTPTTALTTTTVVTCDQCHFGENCVEVRKDSCDCDLCPNFDDQCFDGEEGARRICKASPNLSGRMFSIIFMQNRADSTPNRALEIYATAAGSDDRKVRVYSPYVNRQSDCYFDEAFVVKGFSVRMFSVPNPGCYEQESSGQFSDKMIKVEVIEGGDLLVYAVNRDRFSADAFIAYPDPHASKEFYALTFGPSAVGAEFSILALENDTMIDLAYSLSSKPMLTDTSYILNAGESLQIQSHSEGDLTGTKISSSKPVHVWVGDIRALVTDSLDTVAVDVESASKDHLVEQLIPVRSWGKEYHIQPVPDRIYGDQVRVVASELLTKINLTCSSPSGTTTSTVVNLNAGKSSRFDVLSGWACRLVANKNIMVGQIIKSKDKSEARNDPSLILLPSVLQFTNRYLFVTPLFSGGESLKPRPYNTSLVLLSAKTDDRDGIYIENTVSGIFYASTQTKFGQWKELPDTDYWVKAIQIDFGTNFILHDNQTVTFMCIFYGSDDKESLGFPVGMLLP